MPAGSVVRIRFMLQDSKSAYGWISILLHWVTAILIIALWFIGKSIMAADGEHADARRGLHISLAATAWALILFRIAWRVREGHPHVRGQSSTIHTVAKYTHYASLAAVAVMLLSGPVIVWTRGYPINVFDLFSIPSPFAESEAFAGIVLLIHSTAAAVLMVLIVLHVGGALKHLMFHNDDTIVRMIWPGRRRESEADL